MGQISKEQIAQVIQATDITQLIGTYVALKVSGANFSGLCPFHQEKTPSFVVSPARQNYHCYGCGQYGDAINFLRKVENLTFVEAVEELASRAGIVISGNQIEPSREQNLEAACLVKAQDYFHQHLVDSNENDLIKQYVRTRQISSDSVDIFKLGYARPGNANLRQYLARLKFSDENLLNCGLIKENERKQYYDRFRNRLVFPIRNQFGKTIGFGGRALGDALPKYLNSPETKYYRKSSVFYGLFEAKEHIRKKKQLIVVEGYLDVIRLHDEGWKETIATCGTALTAEHIKVLQQLRVEKIFLLFDGDSAGIRAAEKTALFFLQNSLDGYIVILPDGLDPDDFFKTYGKEDFISRLSEAVYDYEFLIQRILLQYQNGGIDKKQQTIREVLEIVYSVDNSIKRELFLNYVSRVFGIETSNLKGQYRHSNANRVVAKQVESEKLHVFSIRPPSWELKLIQLLLMHTESIRLARNNIAVEEFTHPQLAVLYSRFLSLENEDFYRLKPHDFPEIFIDERNVIMYLLQTAQAEPNGEYSEQMVAQRIGNFKNHQLKKINKEIENTKNEECNLAELFNKRKQLMQQISRLKFKKDPNIHKYFNITKE